MNVTCDDHVLHTVYVCAVGQNASGADLASSTQTGTIQIDQVTPATPTISGISPGDSALDVSWQTSANAVRYRVLATGAGGAGNGDSGEVTGTSHRLDGLTNGVVYDVSVTGISVSGNPSIASATAQASPVQVNDFWKLYKSSGGREQGGCSTGSAGALALLALLPLVLRRRRS